MNTETGRIVTMEELKSCPFCGGEAELCRIFGRIGIACKECNVGVRAEKKIEALKENDTTGTHNR